MAREKVDQRYFSLILWLTFLMYSSVSSTLFLMFACDDLDGGKTYLRADYKIDCNSPIHLRSQIYAAFMVVIYIVGIPVLYAILLFRSRKVLMDGSARHEDAGSRSFSNLWELCRPHRFYYELVEGGRRILLAGLVVFILPNTVGQVAIALVIATFFMVLSEMVDPYDSPWDAASTALGTLSSSAACSSPFC